MDGTVDGKPALSILGDVSIGPDGKQNVIQISEHSFVEQKRGIRGAVQKDLEKMSIDTATYQAEAFNLITQGDHLIYLYEKSTLNYKSQGISTVMNGDPVNATVLYETVNNINRVVTMKLSLPGVNVTVELQNFEYALKL